MILRIFTGMMMLPVLALAGCISAQGRTVGDPLQPMNRAIFGFNTVVDKTVLIPAAKTYKAVAPEPARDGIRNIIANLHSPVILLNDLLQGEWKRAGDTTARFVINTTAGIVGLFDVARRHGIARHKEDFGQTMARAGITAGPYLVLPLLGPSSFRDALGRVPDHFMSPVTYTRFDGKNTFNEARRGAEVIDKRSRNLNAVKKLRRDSLDEYASVRDLYWQTRKDEIANHVFEAQSLPDFDTGE